MKKFFAILLVVCLMVSTLSIVTSAALLTELDAAPVGTVLRISAVKGEATVLVGDHTNFEDGWNAAMEIAGDSGVMKENGYDRIVVDIYTDWKANDDGEFTEEIWNGKGFDNDTIFVPADAKVTLNLNGHTIDRGLTKDEDDGEVMFINDDADVIINNGTITGGYSNSEGGGLYIEGGANVTLNDVHIIGNKVHNDEGAGVYMYGGSKLTVNGGSFENNTADGNGRCGGAVCVKDSTAIFDNVVFKNNRSTYTGAAIYANNSDVTIKNCSFDGNDAQLSVVYSDRSSINVSASTFVNNKGKEMFYLDYSTLTINSSEFKNNNHYNIISTNYSNTVQVTNSTFTGNDACMIYAASYGLDEGSYCRDCTFDENTYKDLVGALPGSFVGNFTNMVFYDCDFGNSNFKYANNVTIENSKDSVTDAALSVTLLHKDGTQKTAYYKAFDFGWNSAVDAAKTNNYERVIVDLLADWNTNEYGVVSIPENARMTLNLGGHKIDRATQGKNWVGEVLYVSENADVIINDGTITGGNSRTGASGIHINDNAKVVLNDVNVDDNHAAGGTNGAAIAVYNGATLVMNGGSLSDNFMDRDTIPLVFIPLYPYGTLYVNDATATLNNVTISNNTAGDAEVEGAAIYADNSTVTLNDCVVSGNINAESDCYAESVIGAEDSTLIINNTDFTDNGKVSGTDDIDYCSLFDLVDCKLIMNGGKITGNHADKIFYLDDTQADIKGVTVTGNASIVLDVDNDSAKVTLTECTLDGNEPVKEEFDVIVDVKGTLTMSNCDLGDTVFEDKRYVDFGNGAGVGSIFGEGSLAMVISILALVTSVVSIFLIADVKKLVSATANGVDKSDAEE